MDNFGWEMSVKENATLIWCYHKKSFPAIRCQLQTALTPIFRPLVSSP